MLAQGTSGTLQLSSFIEAGLLPVVTQIGVDFVQMSLRTPPRVDIGGGLRAQVPAFWRSRGIWGYRFHPVAVQTQCEILWHVRKTGEDLSRRGCKGWRKRLVLAVCSSSLSLPSGSGYRSGQEMPLPRACLTSAQMCTDMNVLGSDVSPSITFVDDLT